MSRVKNKNIDAEVQGFQVAKAKMIFAFTSPPDQGGRSVVCEF